MERITFKKLNEKVSEINAARGIDNNAIGALKVYSDICGYAIDEIVNAGHGVRRLYGMDTPKNCMAYLRGIKG